MRKMQRPDKIAVAIIAAFLMVPFAALAAEPAPCEEIGEANARFTICNFDPEQESLRMFWRDPNGDLYGGFDRLADDVTGSGGTLVFAMNAGMYQPDMTPVGLFVENGREVHAINRRAGGGNFGLKPNGIFWVEAGRAGVTETQKYLAMNLRPAFATQSGPMLVIGGKIHPRIHADGTSQKIRNGVGICEGGRVRFAISDAPVTFYQFAILFRDVLKCPDALFLDGSISALYAPNLKRNDGWRPMGPIVGVVKSGKK